MQRKLFHKNQIIASGSLSALAWRKFRRDRLGFISLLCIALLTLMAILGYLITPDATPFANEQHLELGVKHPGFKVQMLQTCLKTTDSDVNFFEMMLFGKKNTYRRIPISNYYYIGDRIIANEYTGIIGEIGKEIILNKSEIASDRPIVTQRFWLGTDRYGRDILSMLIIGTRVSLAVGLISVLISLLIGITIGSLGGFFRGWVDEVIVWLINVVWSIPTLLLVIAITFALGRGFWQVFVAVGLTMWVEVARITRGQILSIREKEYVEATKALGFSNFRTIYRHILPNVMSPVIVISAGNFASAILIEAGLSFLGIGVQPPMPSWGSMIRDNYSYIILDSAYLAILPGLAIMLLVLAFMLVGNSLRDALDVKIVSG
ncbi:MAG: ABC transporter permease [Bacteroidota bacterium]